MGRFPFWLIFFRWVETTNQLVFASWKKIVENSTPLRVAKVTRNFVESIHLFRPAEKPDDRMDFWPSGCSLCWWLNFGYQLTHQLREVPGKPSALFLSQKLLVLGVKLPKKENTWGSRLVVSPPYLQGFGLHPFGGFCSLDFSHPQWARSDYSWSLEDLMGFDSNKVPFSPKKLRMTMEKQPFQDASPIKNGDIFKLSGSIICEFLVLPYTIFDSECYSYGRTDQRVCIVSSRWVLWNDSSLKRKLSIGHLSSLFQKSKLRSTRFSELPIFAKKSTQQPKWGTTHLAEKLCLGLCSPEKKQKTTLSEMPQPQIRSGFVSLRGQCYLFSWQHLVSKCSRH